MLRRLWNSCRMLNKGECRIHCRRWDGTAECLRAIPRMERLRMRRGERHSRFWQRELPVCVFPAPVVLAAAVWLSTRLCSRSVDGELRLAAVLFVLIGVAHIVTIIPFARTRWISLLCFLLYEAAAAFGFYGSRLEEMGGILFFAIPVWLFLVVMAGEGVRLSIRRRKP